jgi:hypothetical protein
MLGNYCRSLGNYLCRDTVLRLAHLEVRSWMMNLPEVLSALACGYFFFSQNLALAMICLFLNGVFDYLDGGISRARLALGKPLQNAGTTLHILADKISEVVIFSGMIAGKYAHGYLGMLAIMTCLLLTITGLWLQHKNWFDLEDSLFDRADRLIVLLLLCSFGYFNLSLIVVSLLSITEFVHRAWVFAGAKRSP